jgi:small subunit ribosomal protein S4
MVELKSIKKKVNIPSFQCKPKDTIELKKKTTEIGNENQLIPSHLELNKESGKGNILSIVNRDEVGVNINELLIVEFYSRR